MKKQRIFLKYFLPFIICFLVVYFVVTGLGDGTGGIPGEAIVGDNVITKTPIVEGTVTYDYNEPAYKIGLIIRYTNPDDSQSYGIIDSTYTDRQGKYRFYDNGYYSTSKAEYNIYHTFKGEDGNSVYDFIPDAKVMIELGETTIVPEIRLPSDEPQFYADQQTLTSSIDTSTVVQSKMIPSIQGMVFFPDNTPGHDAGIILRQECDEYNVLAQITANAEGYYAFYEVPAGIYWINTMYNNSYTSNVPSAIVIVDSDSTSIVEDLSTRKDMYILLINGFAPSYPRTTIEGPTVEFTWSAVENAAHYEVEIWSTYTEEHPSNRDYEYMETMSSNSFTWSIDSSASLYSEFRIDVRAYSATDTVIAANYELLTVD